MNRDVDGHMNDFWTCNRCGRGPGRAGAGPGQHGLFVDDMLSVWLFLNDVLFLHVLLRLLSLQNHLCMVCNLLSLLESQLHLLFLVLLLLVL